MHQTHANCNSGMHRYAHCIREDNPTDVSFACTAPTKIGGLVTQQHASNLLIVVSMNSILNTIRTGEPQILCH